MTKDRIIKPDEIYKNEIAGVMLENTMQVLIESYEYCNKTKKVLSVKVS